MKDYLAPPKAVSPYKDLISDYKGVVTQGAWGEQGGIPTVIKQQMSPIARKKYNKRKAA